LETESFLTEDGSEEPVAPRGTQALSQSDSSACRSPPPTDQNAVPRARPSLPEPQVADDDQFSSASEISFGPSPDSEQLASDEAMEEEEI
jgi:hypothetical protein